MNSDYIKTMDILVLLAQAFWFIAPAYAANAFPPLVKGKRPIDNGKKWRGKRLFGDGKTIEGTVAGVVFGIIIGLIQIYGQQFIPVSVDGYVLNLTYMTFPIVVLLCIGTMFGDVLGSFIKRRINLKRGSSAPLLDQLGFLVFAIIFASLVYQPDIYIVITLLILTPIIHLLSNIIGYIARVKRQPW